MNAMFIPQSKSHKCSNQISPQKIGRDLSHSVFRIPGGLRVISGTETLEKKRGLKELIRLCDPSNVARNKLRREMMKNLK